jgi:pimeloyl-ACP methyl ester carboxylesterase
MSTGTLHYPTDAEPPLAGISICPGFTNTGPEMAPWGPFYASWGIAVVVTNTEGLDPPNVRGDKLVAAIEELKKQNIGSGPLAGKLSDRFGTSGYSMGGGGTTFASAKAPSYRTSVGLAAWGPDGTNVKVPTLFLCGDTDTVAPCSGSETAYNAMGSTPKMLVKIPNANHFAWFGPGDAGQGISGAYALAFQKVYLEGDERWKPLLVAKPSSVSVTTNIQ